MIWLKSEELETVDVFREQPGAENNEDDHSFCNNSVRSMNSLEYEVFCKEELASSQGSWASSGLKSKTRELMTKVITGKAWKSGDPNFS